MLRAGLLVSHLPTMDSPKIAMKPLEPAPCLDVHVAEGQMHVLHKDRVPVGFETNGATCAVRSNCIPAFVMVMNEPEYPIKSETA